MAKVKVEMQELWNSATGEVAQGYRHPVTHQVVFEDADEVDVETVLPPEPVEPATAEVEVEDPRFEALPEEE